MLYEVATLTSGPEVPPAIRLEGAFNAFLEKREPNMPLSSHSYHRQPYIPVREIVIQGGDTHATRNQNRELFKGVRRPESR